MMKYKIITNPIAGRGTAERAIPRVESLLGQYGLDFELVRTERPWHAAELAKEAVRDGYDVIVAMGGDGTANEVLNGLLLAKEAGDGNGVMGVLCVGRGNDFAYGVGIPSGLEEGCSVLAQGRKRMIDVGRTVVDSSQSRFFGNGVGIGFDAVVGFEAAKMKHLHGFLSYLVAALKTLFIYYKAPTVQIECNGQTWTQPSLMVSVMNGRRMGGGFMMAPEAEPDDGRFDLCIAGMASRLRVLSLMGHFMKGTQMGEDPIRMERSARVIVTAVEGVLPAHADGETLCTEGRRMELEILSNGLEILTERAE